MNKSGREDLLRLLLLFAMGALTGCPNGDRNDCSNACDRGQICDNGICIAFERPLIPDGELATGSGLDLATTESDLFISAINNETGDVTVSIIGPVSESRIIHTFDELVGQTTRISTSTNRVAVAWREGSQFVIASRALGSVTAFWDYEVVEISEPYKASRYFDLALDSADSPHIVYHDGTGTLNHLSRTSDGSWRNDLIDDGGSVASGRGCDAQQRRVGLDPKFEIFTQFTVSYFDDVCGDLRLARRVEDRWVVEIVDEGVDVVQSENDRVGRFSSLAIDANKDLRITYFDEKRGRLLLAQETDGRFEVSVIDEGIEVDSFARTRKLIVGSYSSLIISPTSEERVVYFDATNQALKSAVRYSSGSAWAIETLDENNVAGLHARIALRGVDVVFAFERLVPTRGTIRSEQVWGEVAR